MQRKAFTTLRREKDGTIFVRHNLTGKEYPVEKNEEIFEDQDGNVRYFKR
jgi:hypothetical protein